MTEKTHQRLRGTTPEIDQAARKLRHQPTSAEFRLWQALRSKKLNGLRFRRQHPVGRFILDFYCPSCKLAIELDGAIHQRQAEYDAARTQQLEQFGYRVIRFRNEQVMEDLPGVLAEIAQIASE
ncbi:endonuclease domain-containing protein [Lusitaniella coriacea LEGE 07157]|uniref:Endonuclease domain-containing protein n=1 Tax=Lusitaniella coriacea LEGE 07157 TaxID=945747 RepID=A0A8J7AYL5_9CYAN|nr:endonuclease domain-containing protein [Lusitaniella coriacea]MBE9114989.1 endonuclease domain-containing protein [Lusitaniella coriacea LEGE 07157]